MMQPSRLMRLRTNLRYKSLELELLAWPFAFGGKLALDAFPIPDTGHGPHDTTSVQYVWSFLVPLRNLAPLVLRRIQRWIGMHQKDFWVAENRVMNLRWGCIYPYGQKRYDQGLANTYLGTFTLPPLFFAGKEWYSP